MQDVRPDTWQKGSKKNGTVFVAGSWESNFSCSEIQDRRGEYKSSIGFY